MFNAIFIVSDATSEDNSIDKILASSEKANRIRERIVFDIVST